MPRPRRTLKRALARPLRWAARVLRRAADRLDPDGRFATGGMITPHLWDGHDYERNCGIPTLLPLRSAEQIKLEMRAFYNSERLRQDLLEELKKPPFPLV